MSNRGDRKKIVTDGLSVNWDGTEFGFLIRDGGEWIWTWISTEDAVAVAGWIRNRAKERSRREAEAVVATLAADLEADQ